MIGIIVEDKKYIKIKELVKEFQYETIFEYIGEEVGIKSEIQKNINIRVDKLLIDMDFVFDIEDLLQSIINYRLRYDNVQIVVFTRNYKRGDSLLSLLAGQGAVYDILCYEDIDELDELIRESFRKPNTYKNGIRFMTGVGIEKNNNLSGNFEVDKIPATKIKEIKERILLGSALIAIGSTFKGVGSTSLSLGIAFYLANKGYKVALLEGVSEIPIDFSISNIEVEKKVNGAIEMGNVDIFPYKENEDLFFNLKETYNYIILDLGSLLTFENNKLLKNKYFSEMNRATIPILLIPSAVWKLNRLEEFQKYINHNWKLVGNLASKEDIEDMQNIIKDKEIHQLHSFNCFELKDKDIDFFKRLLKEVLPEEKTERKGIFKKFLKTKE